MDLSDRWSNLYVAVNKPRHCSREVPFNFRSHADEVLVHNDSRFLEAPRNRRTFITLVTSMVRESVLPLTYSFFPVLGQLRFLCLVARVPGCRTEMYFASCEVRTEFIYVM
jgi:hypothetical protein